MKKLFLALALLVLASTRTMAANEIGPEGFKLLWIILIGLCIFLLLWFMLFRKSKISFPKIPFLRKLKIELVKNKYYKPTHLNLVIKNISSKDVDIEAPVILFRKLFAKRKFKLKGINKSEIYPLYLEKGKTHDLLINLSVFHNYDRKLKKYYWCRVFFEDTKGRKYSTKYVKLRSSLFS